MITRIGKKFKLLEYGYDEVRNFKLGEVGPWYKFIYNNATDKGIKQYYYYAMVLQDCNRVQLGGVRVDEYYKPQLCPDILNYMNSSECPGDAFVHGFNTGIKVLLIKMDTPTGVEFLNRTTDTVQGYYKELK